MKLANFLAAHALRTPDREALKCDGQTLSFAELHNGSTRLANSLIRNGLAVGDRVLISLANRVEFLMAFMGAVKAGGVVVTPNPRLSTSELAYVFSDSSPAAVIYEGETHEAIEKTGYQARLRYSVDGLAGSGDITFSELVQEPDDRVLRDIPPDFDDCMISYTSGTTGRPKGAILTQMNYITSNGFLNAQQWGMNENDRILTTTPVAHRSAFARLMNVICLGSSVVIMRRMDTVEAVQLIESEKITVLNMVTTVARMLLPAIEAAPERFRSVTKASVTGEAFPVEVKRRLCAALPDLKLLSFFAMTEIGAVTLLLPEEQLTKGASVGRVNPGLELKLVDGQDNEVPRGETGEILVRSGPAGCYVTMRGYFNNPQATRDAIHDGWVRTGDLGRLDDEGYLYIVDRKKDMVLSGGYNIYCKEVEAVIINLDGVQDAAVVGVPDELYGEAVAAFVELSPGATMSATEVIDHCRESIASYKKPKHVTFVASLPRNNMGKVLKFELRKQFEAAAR
jgi:long-chain acyl-CoA synthetase